MKPPREAFRPCVPPRVVRDHTLADRPVLLLGWWLDDRGRELAAEVATMASRRRPFDISEFPPIAAPVAAEDEVDYAE